MKKNVFAAILMTAVVFLTTGCGNSAKQTETAIQIIGTLSVVERTIDGETGLALLNAEGTTVSNVGELYKDISGETAFIRALKNDGSVDIYDLDGNFHYSCDSLKMKNYFATGETPSEKQYLEISFGERVNAINLDNLNSILQIESSREAIYPLDNGMNIYLFDRTYGIANSKSSEPIIGNECKEITVICTADKVVYLVKTDSYTGYIDDQGNGFKRLSRAQYKKALKAGKLLWEDGKVSARLVKKI